MTGHCFVARTLALAAVFLPWCVEPAALGGEPAEKQDVIVEREEMIIVGEGVPTMGRFVLPANENGFRFELSDNGKVVSFRWADLPEPERKRVRKRCGLDVAEDARLHPEDGFDDDMAPLEAYAKWMKERPPGKDDAPAHIAMAQRCAVVGLYTKAVEHLRAAEALGPLDKYGDLLAAVVEQEAKQRVERRYDAVVAARNAGNYGSALYRLRKIPRNLLVEWGVADRIAMLTPGIEAHAGEEARKCIIWMSYDVACDLLLQRLATKVRLDERGKAVRPIPGKSITTRRGRIIRGTLIAGEPGKDMVLSFGEKEVVIAAKDVLIVEDTDVSVAAREVPITFEQLKAYVCDTESPDGLKARMIAAIAETIGKPAGEVKDVFDTRLDRQPVRCVLHDACYGRGSWLREGSKPAPLTPAQLPAGHGADADETRRRGSEDPELTDDPRVWWRSQTRETQWDVAKALMAEKVFAAKVTAFPCPVCTGAGVVSETPPGKGEAAPTRCAACRGIGSWWKVLWR